jgi:hypothetical protein
MRFHGWTPRFAHRLACALVMVVFHASASAESPPGQDAAIAAEVASALPPAPREIVTSEVPPARPRFWLGRFVDHLDLGNRLSQIKSLKLVPIWDGRRLSVFFGVNHRGMPGLHFQQQDPGYAARVAMEPPSVTMPLRAVPLNAL